MNSNHLPFPAYLCLRHDLAPPHGSQGLIFRLERNSDVSPSISSVANGAILPIERDDGEVVHRCEQTMEALSQCCFSFRWEGRDQIEADGLLTHKGRPSVEITLRQSGAPARV